MGYVTIDEVSEKMVLTENILNPNGLIILAKGTVLTQIMIERLKNLRIAGLSVQEAQTAAAACPDSVSGNEQNLECRFSLVRGDPIMEELLVAVKSYFSKKDADNGN